MLDFLTTGHFAAMLVGAKTTLWLAVASATLGLILGMVFALFELSRFAPLRWGTSLFVSTIRSLPELILIFLIGIGIPYLFIIYEEAWLPVKLNFLWNSWFGHDFEFSFFWLGVIALGVVYAAYASQTLRGALLAVPRPQWQSGAVLGLKKPSTFFYIILPQMWRHAFPGLGNQWLILLKDTALVSLIAIEEVMQKTDYAFTSTGNGFTWYGLAALIYLVISVLSQKLQTILYNRMTAYER